MASPEQTNTPPQLFELPETNPAIDGLLPQYREAAWDKLAQDRAATQTGIDAQFAAHPDLIQPGEDGAEVLTLQMPWQSSAARRPGTATLTLSRKVDAAGSTSTDLTFSSNRAWNNWARVVTVGGETRVLGMTPRREDGVWVPGAMAYEKLDAAMWRKNIETATPASQRRGLMRFVGRQATKG